MMLNMIDLIKNADPIRVPLKNLICKTLKKEKFNLGKRYVELMDVDIVA